jgi:transmembrane sensor
MQAKGMNSRTDPDQAEILDEAIGWSMALREDELLPEERHAFDEWLDADVRHRQVWYRLQESLGPLHAMRNRPVSGEQLVSSLRKVRTSRRDFLVRNAIGVASTAMVIGAVDRFVPLAGMGADYRTFTGQRRQLRLPDGSRLALNARSRANLAFDDASRGLLLGQGTACVDVASWGAGVAPFGLSAGPARLAAAAGRIMMSELEGEVRAISISAEASLVVDGAAPERMRPGEGYAIANGAIRPLPASETMDAASWIGGSLTLHDRLLSDLVAALRPYRAGVLSVSERVAKLRVSGVFDLDNLDATLGMLTRLFPISVLRVGPFFSRIDFSQ